MASWKSKFVDAYRWTTCPYRAWSMFRRRKTKQVPVFVVFYHRVSDERPNGWTIGCKDFERQISWLERNFDLVDLEECQRRITSGKNTRPTVAITFDDGYAENSEFALPLLLERRIPTTYFVSLDFVKSQKPFPHDVEAGHPLPVHTIESLRALSVSGIEIGAHSRNHTDLGTVTDPNTLVDEVITSSRELAELIDSPIRYFAFPYGKPEHLNEQAFALLKHYGFHGACTTIHGWNEVGQDAFQISRIHGDPNFSRFRNWLTFDPRLSRIKKFAYDEQLEPVTKNADSAIFPTTPQNALIGTTNAISCE